MSIVIDYLIQKQREKPLWEQFRIPIELHNIGKYWLKKPIPAEMVVSGGIEGGCIISDNFAISGFGNTMDEIHRSLQDSMECLAVAYYGGIFEDLEFSDGGKCKEKWKEYFDLESVLNV